MLKWSFIGAAGCCISLAAQAADPVSVCSGVPYSSMTPVTAQIHADGPYFRADDGRYVQLRGVNAVGKSKMPPFKALNASAMLDPLPGWGINVLRFLFTWEAFEPASCSYSEDYLAYYEQAVKWAAERGIHVIVDFHQDAFSRYALGGCGEGAPLWALTSRVTPATPDNGQRCEGWGAKATFSPQNYLVFDRFFKDDQQAMSHYVEMTRRVAARLAQYPNVIGYDMMNEPYGNAATLGTFYSAVGAAIRQKHPSAMLFFEPELNTIGPMLPVSVSTIEKPPFDNVVFAPHYYSAEIFTVKTWLGDSPGLVFAQWKEKTDAWNIPLLIGEFGTPPTFGNGADYVEAHYRWFDKTFVSGTQWNYNPGWTPQQKDGWNFEDMSINDENLQLRSTMFQTRPYPQKTAGRPVRFERQTAGFTYAWSNDPSLGAGKTEFYVPEGYASGKSWKASPFWAGVSCAMSGSHQAICQSNYRGWVSVTLK